MRPGCARFRHSSLHALRSSSGSGLGLPSGSTRTRTRTLFKPNSQGRGRANAAVMYAMLSLLFCTLARCALPLLCLAAVLQPTALPSVEITKLDSHLRYCTLTATPPAFHHSAQAATPMPVASLRLLTRLDSAATAALPGMLSDRHPQACSTSTRSLCARRSLQGRLFPCQPRSERRMHPALACPCYRFAPSNLAAPRPGNTSFVRCVSYCRCP